MYKKLFEGNEENPDRYYLISYWLIVVSFQFLGFPYPRSALSKKGLLSDDGKQSMANGSRSPDLDSRIAESIYLSWTHRTDTKKGVCPLFFSYFFVSLFLFLGIA